MSMEKIIAKIDENANSEAKRIIDEAKETADKYREESAKKLERELNDIKSETSLRADDIKKRYTSSDDLACRKMRLAARREVMDSVYEDAKGKLLSNDALYIRLLKKLVLDCAKEAGGTVFPSAYDARFFDDGFMGEIKAAAVNDVSLGEPANIDRGFVYRAETVEFDCSIDTVFEQLKKDTETEVNDVLFEER